VDLVSPTISGSSSLAGVRNRVSITKSTAKKAFKKPPTVVKRTISSSSSSVSGLSPRKRKKGKGLKQQLRETVLDDGSGDVLQRLRLLEYRNDRLEQKLAVKREIIANRLSKEREVKALKREVEALNREVESLKREIENIKSDWTDEIKDEKFKRLNEKAKFQKKISVFEKRLDTAEMELEAQKSIAKAAAIAPKNKDEKSGADNAYFQDVLANLKELLDTQLQCSICNEIFVYASSINCGHTYCENCISGWRKKQPDATCPICRADIILVVPNQALDSYVDKFVDNFFPEDSKITRLELLAERKIKKEQRGQDQEGQRIPGLLGPAIRRRILNLEGEDEDSWDEDFVPRRFEDFFNAGFNSPGGSSSSSDNTTRSARSDTPSIEVDDAINIPPLSDSDDDDSDDGPVVNFEEILANIRADHVFQDVNDEQDNEEDSSEDDVFSLSDGDNVQDPPAVDDSDDDDDDDDDDNGDDDDVDVRGPRRHWMNGLESPAFSDDNE
jgi:hypothetical protein